MNAVTELSSQQKIEADAAHPYHQPITLSFSLPTRFYAGMYAIWLLRPALQQRFPLHKGRQQDYLKFLAWCVGVGRRQYALLREIEAWNKELDQPIILPRISSDIWHNCYTNALYLTGIYRAGFWPAFFLHNKKIRYRATRWFFRDGRELLGFTTLPVWQRQAVLKNFGTSQAFINAISLPKDNKTQEGVAHLQKINEDILQHTAPADTKKHHAPITVKQSNRSQRSLAKLCHPITTRLLNAKYKRYPRASMAELTKLMNGVTQLTNPKGTIKSTLPFGVNLYGYARGELGIGEDVRMMALSLQAANIPFCIINIEPGNDVSQNDNSAEQWIADTPRYAINIFCMTGIEHCRLVCEQGTSLLQNHYNIGLWPWELPQWPAPWEHSFHLVDEIWGISHYTSAAYSKAPVPVHPVPLPVILGEISPLGRAHWQLPENAYLFVFSFDMNSTLSRKNPMAVINAFLAAFPAHMAKEVGLVVKVSHIKPNNPEWQELQTVIQQDQRIYLISQELRRPEVLALYRCCNCYVSLHRAEGFGRGLAEAQLLGLQLITTAYSGNMDFCSPPTRLVRYQPVALQAGEYFYGDGQLWADPDIDDAAAHMQQCVAQSNGNAPVEYELTRFTPEYCGEIFKQKLFQLNY
jgi:hypothetical protein